jgi:hypothetical protein
LLQSCKSSIGRRVVLLLAVALLPVAWQPVQAQSLSASLLNGSFESGSGSNIPGWTFSAISGAGSVQIVVKTTNPNTSPPVDTGSKSVQMTVTQPGTMYLGSGRVTVSPNLRYRFTARLKAATQNQQGALHAVEWGTGSVPIRDTTLALSSGLNANWETLRGYLVTQAGTQSVEIRLMPVLPQGGGAQLYWDSLDLTKGDATAWEPWETTLTSTVDYSPPVANPYKDLILTATFFKPVPAIPAGGTCPTAPPSSCTGANCFQGYGFWDGVPGTSSSRTFKVRTLLPAGNWCWAVSCAGPAGQCSSATEPGLNTHSAMPVVVLANVTPANKLYALGMPRPSSSSRFLVYGDNATTFPWIADTAWMAPVNYTPSPDPVPSHDLWSSYLWDRVHKNFTTILVAPAPQYLQPPLPANVLGFRSMPKCKPNAYNSTSVVPNDCTYWDAPYWQNFDQMVTKANSAGLMIVVAGVMDPMDRSGTNTQNLNEKFPNPDMAVVFARNFAARLAGSYVIFSPGFDDRVNDLTVDGRRAKDSMNAVGTALKVGSPIAAVPRHLVVNHLAGGSALIDYDAFQGSSWLSFQMFQSGHAANAINSSVQCLFIDAWTYAICRARELALRFRCMGDPSIPSPPCTTPPPTGNIKPAVNAEAAYETYSPTEGTIVDQPIGVRNTAYSTTLSGSFGVTLGVEGIYKWNNPGIFRDSYNGNQSQSDNDLALLASLLRGGPWTDLTPRHNLIINNSTAEKQKILLAGSSAYALLYAPDLTGTPSVSISLTAPNAISNLRCKTWSGMWVRPVASSPSSTVATCSDNTSQITFSAHPSCLPTSCDWVLKLTANGVTLPPPLGGTSQSPANNLMVWSVESADGLTSDILGQVLDSDGNSIGDPIAIHSDGQTFGKLPTVAVDSFGNFLVAWQSEFPDGTLDSISTRWLDSNGNPLTDTVQMVGGSDGQQAEPALGSDPSGAVILTWTAYDADGTASGIYRLDVLDGGPPPDEPMLVSDPSQLAVSSSQVQASAQGSSVVAWNGTDGSTDIQGVYFQRFNSHGRPIGQQRQVGHQTTGRRRLAKLYVDAQGAYRIRSESFGSANNLIGTFEQKYLSDGTEDGSETQIGPNS